MEATSDFYGRGSQKGALIFFQREVIHLKSLSEVFRKVFELALTGLGEVLGLHGSRFRVFYEHPDAAQVKIGVTELLQGALLQQITVQGRSWVRCLHPPHALRFSLGGDDQEG